MRKFFGALVACLVMTGCGHSNKTSALKDSGPESVTIFTTLPNQDVPGNDIGQYTADYPGCFNLCNSNPYCKAYHAENGQCYLKGAVGAVANSGGLSGFKYTYSFSYNVDAPGGDLFSFSGSVQNCEYACANNYQCVAFFHDANTCFLKANVGAFTLKPSGTFGTKH